MLAERGIDASYETVRYWTIKFGPLIARSLKRRRPAPSPRWHLDEIVVRIGGKRMYLWRAVDHEGEVLDMVVQKGRDTAAALKILKRLLRNQPIEPSVTITVDLASYGAALRELDLLHLHRPGRLRENNRAENSHLPDAIILTPVRNELAITLRGDLASILALSRSNKKPGSKNGTGLEKEVQISLVAGARNHRELTLSCPI